MCLCILVIIFTSVNYAIKVCFAACSETLHAHCSYVQKISRSHVFLCNSFLDNHLIEIESLMVKSGLKIKLCVDSTCSEEISINLFHEDQVKLGKKMDYLT